jgi:hypothetical protein
MQLEISLDQRCLTVYLGRVLMYGSLNSAEIEERVINADHTASCVSPLGTVRQVTNRMDITCGSLAEPK